MLENVHNQAGGPRPADPTGPTHRPTSATHRLTGAARTETRGPAFEALLEHLEAQARELSDKSRSVERPAELADAVGQAHDSLEAALSLGDRLLEAFRERLQRGGEASGGNSGSGAGDGPAGGAR
jgi:hypothetical protein